ncbi:hypothetical protein J1P26_20855 [Neobacillus sp. MM2021_6]|nr:MULTISPECIES: hypothetical protein [Bacillaceae]MBO0962161.1 hypothetical protein [Neobacillus sp. MM2021_6]NHC21066.1 hypothetical protein [Bacillus sp. MM2020_4]
MRNQNLTEQLEVATQHFKANSPIEAQFKIGQMEEILQELRNCNMLIFK